MKVVRDLAKLDTVDVPRSVVALGTFDGVHLGHQEILRRCVVHARRAGARAVVFTFDKHPLQVIRPQLAPAQLTDIEDKLALIEATGVELAVVARFDEAFARATPEEFVREVLLDGLRAAGAVVGFNYTFGWRARGTATVLAELGKKYGFDVEIAEPVSVGSVPVGSTEIRARLARGDVAGARAMLGRPFSVKGAVVPGEGRGRTLGYPTANIRIGPTMAVPARGVYAVLAEVQGGRFQAVANVGVRPTFDGRVTGIEVFVMDFAGDIYGETMRVSFIERLRDEMRFSSPLALASQIADDVKSARKVLSSFHMGNTDYGTRAVAAGARANEDRAASS
ncbi:MAG: bifunctional riboflavin kinase/FAD synthetase [Betaproteobacteria bacterium]